MDPLIPFGLAVSVLFAAACSSGESAPSPQTGGSGGSTGGTGGASTGGSAGEAGSSAGGAAGGHPTGGCDSLGPVTPLHFAANGGGVSGGIWPPAAVGFNLADVSSVDEANELPAGVNALVWVGMCNGADAAFVSAVQPFAGNSRVFGFYLIDEPDPTGQYSPLCSAADLKAESEWIHANIPGTKTFIVLMNMGSSSEPSFENTYNPANSDIDLYGVDPYPCRVELAGCDYSMIAPAVTAAVASGIPLAAIVPVYQAFGGGAYTTDTGGSYQLPTADQERQIMIDWAAVVPSPSFDMVYSWGTQNGDEALSGSAELQQVFALHNAGCGD